MSNPRVSIGLPVYNGERYLAAALGSLLDQRFSDFELIVSDNASTDRTPEIIEAFAATDSRIRWHRFDTNQGAARNYNQTVAMAQGAYFKWAAHDDACEADFLGECVAVLDAEPDTVLCHSVTGCLDAEGHRVGIYASEQPIDAPQVHRRFRQAISTPHICTLVFGVMRLDILRRTPMHGNWLGADRNLLAELALHGKLRMVPQVLFWRRDHPQTSIRIADQTTRRRWFDPNNSRGRAYPTWRRGYEYGASLCRVPLSLTEKFHCISVLGGWPLAQHHTGVQNLRLLWRELCSGGM